ncbi:MAG: hypothetical protein NWQ09_00270 [Nonlabens sp.]|nr:hypothetical protein [Nonlabens sp.]
MKKKIAADLTSLAHKVLQLKNHDTTVLKATAQALYDKLCVLEFIEKHYDGLGPTIGKAKALEILENDIMEVIDVQKPTQGPVNTVVEEEEEISFESNDLSDLFMPVEDDTREVMDLPGISTISKMVEEMPDDVPEVEAVVPQEIVPPPIPVTPPAVPEIPERVEITSMEDLEQITADFQNMPEFERKTANDLAKPVSLNDRLNKGLVIGMNDRLGFVKHLFGGNDQDLNRVLSQLNTMESYDSAKHFVATMVKPDYNNWSGKENYEERFMDLLERKFES